MCSDWQPGDKIQMWAFITLGTHINTRHPQAPLWIANSFATKKTMRRVGRESATTLHASHPQTSNNVIGSGCFFAVLLLADGPDSLPFSVALISLGVAQLGMWEGKWSVRDAEARCTAERLWLTFHYRDKLCLGWTLMVYSTAWRKPGEFDERNNLEEMKYSAFVFALMWTLPSQYKCGNTNQAPARSRNFLSFITILFLKTTCNSICSTFNFSNVNDLWLKPNILWETTFICIYIRMIYI